MNMASILDLIGRFARPEGVNIPTTVPMGRKPVDTMFREPVAQMPMEELQALAGSMPQRQEAEPRRESFGSKLGKGALAALALGAIGPEAVQAGGGIADLYLQNRAKREAEDQARKMMAAKALEQRQKQERQDRIDSERSSLASQKNVREWAGLAGKGIDWLFPKGKEWSPADQALAKQREEMLPLMKQNVQSQIDTRSARASGRGGGSVSARAVAGSPSASKRVGADEQPIQAAAPVTEKDGRLVPTTPEKKAIFYESKTRPVVEKVRAELAASGLSVESLLRPDPDNPSRKPIDSLIEKVAQGIPAEDRALVVRAIMAGLGKSVPRVKAPMEPDFKDEGVISTIRNIGAYPADVVDSLAKFFRPKPKDQRNKSDAMTDYLGAMQ
jgi:hypothetical protein